MDRTFTWSVRVVGCCMNLIRRRGRMLKATLFNPAVLMSRQMNKILGRVHEAK